jgi:hypothetical protein
LELRLERKGTGLELSVSFLDVLLAKVLSWKREFGKIR